MGLTYSKTTLIGMQAPVFMLPDTVSGQSFSLAQLCSDRVTAVMFICNHCPYVKHIEKQLADLVKEYQPKGVSFIAISANDAQSYPQDAPDKLRQYAANVGYTFPYLYDETQQVAKAYGAECTPEFYLFDKVLSCIYHGRFDDSSPGKTTPVTGNDFRAALDAALLDKLINEQYPAMGCNIKWKS